ncbi:2-oxoglutarate dehydrogenase complex dihydrolipoyllysine-residue succinyltransferase [Gilvimarinus xylanilyticus]|uniref:Dihydrolipoyllysine-residue succinyltransferase component of 2-oxoglutarate dehydrogenase complex n=1 Tax=Gilvimarinus xylanilyticus TaxID=2944139 RepID=A0A9X2I2B0_9GAMM|nr:2-oxoglutarate dehydrogenase complex dihydrolipoyllysine-residue succinyltransferase [Gilvimarinus xylanilyticus]MCP8898192.1 2-oxoglutarate dehydrogenase complex dihydrolipoyllysine-residue succinyltransferase [Gilvimarinus xylanilyticus]
MSTDIKAPTFPESVQDGTLATWHKQPGEACSRDELIVDIETDKVVLEVVAPADGVISEVLKAEGDTIQSNEVIAKFDEGASGSGAGEKASEASEEKSSEPEAEPAASGDDKILSPAARKMADENNIDPASVKGTGKDGRVTKEDVMNHIKDGESKPAAPAPSASKAAEPAPMEAGERVEKRVPMTRLRKRIAERLLEATSSTAMLTTFNEVNMAPVMELRKQYKEKFEKVHNGTRLGFMGFFVKAATEALKRFPAVNASIDGDDVVYHGYQDIGVAVSTEKGLVVPILRNSENMSIAEVESTIRDFGKRAQAGKLSIDEMTGGTFTITNGGVFGSLLSTPILNLPQTAILGMHKIQERPMAVNGKVEIQPMMYLALSYDHRLIDGKDAVQFLVALKELLEDPARILLEI